MTVLDEIPPPFGFTKKIDIVCRRSAMISRKSLIIISIMEDNAHNELIKQIPKPNVPAPHVPELHKISGLSLLKVNNISLVFLGSKISG